MLKKRIRAILSIALGILLTLVTGFLAIFALLQYHPVQRFVLHQFLKSHNVGPVKITFSKARVSLWNPVTVRANSILLRYDNDNAAVSIPLLTATFKPLNLIRGKFVPYSLRIVKPELRFNGSMGKWSGGLKELASASGAAVSYVTKVRYLYVRNGRLSWKDFNTGPSTAIFNLTQRPKKDHSRIVADAEISQGQRVCSININGKFESLKGGRIPVADFETHIKSLPISWLPRNPGVRPKSGDANINAHVIYRSSIFHFDASVALKNPAFSLQSSSREKDYYFPWLSLTFSGQYKNGTIDVPKFKLDCPDTVFHGLLSCYLEDSRKVVDLKIKSPFLPFEAFRKIFPDPLVGRWVPQVLLPVLSGGFVKVENFSVSGSIDQISKLNLPQNRSCLALEITWKGLNALEGKRPFAFRASSGRLTISNGKLDVSEVKGSYGHSQVLNGEMEISDLYSEKIRPYIHVSGRLDLADIPQLGGQSLSKNLLPASFAELEDISGTSMVELSGSVKGDSGFKLDLARLDTANCKLTYKTTPINLTDVDVMYRQALGYRFKGKIGIFGSSLRVCGQGSGDFSQLSLWAEGRGNLEIIRKTLAPEAPVHFESTQPTQMSFSLNRFAGKMKLEGLVSLTNTKMRHGILETRMGRPGEMLFFRLREEENQTCLDDIIWFQDRGFVQGSFSYHKKEKKVEATVFAKEASLEGLKIGLGNAMYDIGGTLDCDLKAEGRSRQMSKFTLFGDINAYGLTVRKDGHELPFTQCQVSLGFKGKQINLNCMKTNVSGFPVFVTGQFTGWDRPVGSIHIELEGMDILSLIMGRLGKGENGSSKMLEVLPNGSNIHVSLNVSRAALGTMDRGQLEVSGLVRKGAIHLEKCVFSSPHMKVSTVGYLKSKEMGGYYLTSYVEAKGLPLEELIRALGQKHPSIEGTLNMTAILTSQGRELKEFVPRLSGEGNFEISKGKILKSTVLIKVLNFLSVQKIFTKEPPNLSKGGFYFRQIKGSVEIENGIVRSDEVVMSSPVFNAVAKGRIDLNTKKIRAELGARPFVTIDSVLSKVPLVGYILTGKERALLVYYFKVRGHLNDPEVQYVPLKNMGKSTLLFLRRAFLTPVRIFKNIRNALEKLSKMGKPVPLEGLESPAH